MLLILAILLLSAFNVFEVKPLGDPVVFNIEMKSTAILLKLQIKH